MYKKFKEFLNVPFRPITPRSLLDASKCTWLYYSQRRELAKEHKLRPYHLPYILFTQIKVDYKKWKINQDFNARLHKYQHKETLFRDITDVRYYIPDRHKILKESISPGLSITQRLRHFWTEIKSDSPFPANISFTIQNFLKYLRSASWISHFSAWVVNYINLYHKALQEMVEGHREATKNHQTIINGQKIEDKLKDFEQKLNSNEFSYEKAKDSVKNKMF